MEAIDVKFVLDALERVVVAKYQGAKPSDKVELTLSVLRWLAADEILLDQAATLVEDK